MINAKHALHEALAMFIFVAINCYVANTVISVDPAKQDAKHLTIALSFGLTITALVYMFAKTSGGQINAAVTLTLMLTNNLSVPQGIANMAGQFAGALGGSFYVHWMFHSDILLGGLGVNAVAPMVSSEAVIIAESVCTFLLCYVVLATAVDVDSIARLDKGDADSNPIMAPVAIGFAVFIGHLVCIPLSGCSINPTRSLGPAVVSGMLDREAGYGDVWVCFVPFIGSALAWLVWSAQNNSLCDFANSSEAATRNTRSQKTVDRKRSSTQRKH